MLDCFNWSYCLSTKEFVLFSIFPLLISLNCSPPFVPPTDYTEAGTPQKVEDYEVAIGETSIEKLSSVAVANMLQRRCPDLEVCNIKMSLWSYGEEETKNCVMVVASYLDKPRPFIYKTVINNNYPSKEDVVDPQVLLDAAKETLRFADTRINLYYKIKISSPLMNIYKANLQNKWNEKKKIESLYREVIKGGDIGMAIRSLYRIGTLSENLADGVFEQQGLFIAQSTAEVKKLNVDSVTPSENDQMAAIMLNIQSTWSLIDGLNKDALGEYELALYSLDKYITAVPKAAANLKFFKEEIESRIALAKKRLSISELE